MKSNPATTPTTFDQQLEFLTQSNSSRALSQILRGIEKEGLRVRQSDCSLAQTPHPTALGSPLTNGWVTTDFSEALLEFITPANNSIKSALSCLTAEHAIAATHLSDEVIWAASMPCQLPADNAIPLAKYGTSNIAQMKTAYRRGLGHRYGRAMQTVAGIHYNFSLPANYWQLEAEHKNTVADQAYINTRYLDLIRNFRRHYWLLIYLLGASPCTDASFVQDRCHNLQQSETGDLFLPYATSLRMGDLGYQSAAQKSLFICYNELNTYIKTLEQAMHNAYPPYNIFGLKKNGVYQQLSTSLLQIENEFYSPIRPKRVASPGEKPLQALSNRGIEYIEVRCIDIAPYSRLGIDDQTIRFLDAFLLTCLNTDSPPCDENEFAQIGENQARIVHQGRKPGISIFVDSKEVPMAVQAKSIFSNILAAASALDLAHNTDSYTVSVNAQLDKVDNPEITPSGRLTEELNTNKLRYIERINELSNNYITQHRTTIIDKELKDSLETQAKESIIKQREIENSDTLTLTEYLDDYFSNNRSH